MKQVKCPHCHQWSSDPDVCDKCGAPISREKREEVKRGGKKKVSAPEPPGKLQQFFIYAQQSKNPFVKIAYYLIMSIWGVYVGMVVILMYIAAAASG